MTSYSVPWRVSYDGMTEQPSAEEGLTYVVRAYTIGKGRREFVVCGLWYVAVWFVVCGMWLRSVSEIQKPKRPQYRYGAPRWEIRCWGLQIQPNTHVFGLRQNTFQIHSRPTTQDALQIQPNTYVFGPWPNTVNTYFPSRMVPAGKDRMHTTTSSAVLLVIGAMCHTR